MTQKNGTTSELIMKDVLYVPQLWVNLLSITKAISYPRVHLSGNDNNLSLTLGNDVITFDQKLANGSKTGWLLGVEIIPIQVTESVNITMDSQSYDYIHGLLGHPNEKVTKATAKILGMKIKDSPKTVCLDWLRAKQKGRKLLK